MYTDPRLEEAQKWAPPPPPGTPQGVALPGTEKPGRTAIYRHWRVGGGKMVETVDPEITTMFEAFEAACRKWPKNNCLGWRERDGPGGKWGRYKWMNYQTAQQRRTNFGAGLVHLHRRAGISANRFAVGLWASNRPEWQIADLGSMAYGLYTVSLYETLGPDTTEFIINHAELPCIVTSLDHIPVLLSIRDRVPSLKIIISVDPLDAGETPSITKKAILGQLAAQKGLELYSMQEVEDIGMQHPQPLTPPTPEDPITINYTSGTTGNPKGVLLSHKNCIAACSVAMGGKLAAGPRDIFLSYLPLAHIYARVAENTALWGGSATGYFHGVMAEVAEDIKELRPTCFPSVPRLFNRIARGIEAATVDQPGLAGAFSRQVVSTKLQNLQTHNINTHFLYDRIWCHKVKTALGLERCKASVSGSAPISPQVLQFLRVVFANDLVEGYGMTETYATITAQISGDFTAGNVGPPCTSIECVLRDVPDMGYRTTDKPYPRGELLVRGPLVFKEYFKAPEITAEVFDEDGWFRTGDIFHIDELGRLSMIDRVKNLLKLAQGEYVSPEKVENIYTAGLPIFAQALVHGDSFQTYLVAVFGIDRQYFTRFAEKILGKKIEEDDDRAILAACANKEVRRAVLKEMEKVSKNAKLAGFERVRNVHLCIDPLTVENDLLTPTLKLRRAPAIKVYKEILDQLYREHDAENPPKAKL